MADVLVEKHGQKVYTNTSNHVTCYVQLQYVWVLTGRQMSESEGWSCVHASTPSAAFCLTLEIVLCLVMCPDI